MNYFSKTDLVNAVGKNVVVRIEILDEDVLLFESTDDIEVESIGELTDRVEGFLDDLRSDLYLLLEDAAHNDSEEN